MDNGHQVETRNTAHFRHDYGSDQSDLRRLYEQAKIDQWNAATDIDWAVPLEGDGGLISDDLVDIHGTRFWDRLSEKDRSSSTAASAAGGSRPWCRASMAPCCCAASSSRTCRARTPSCSSRPRWPTRRGTTRCCSAISSCGSTARSIRWAATCGRSSTRCSAPRRGTSRRSACSWSPRPSPSRCSACWRSPPRTRCCARSAAASCRTRRATWASPCCRCRPSSARRPKPSIARWRISPCGRSAARCPASSRSPSTRRWASARPSSRRSSVPPRARGRRRRDRLPQVLPPRPA